MLASDPMAPAPSSLPLHETPLPYAARLQSRPEAQVDLVVIHCTELPDLAMAREFGERVLYEATGTGNSGHYYIDRDGTAHRWVDAGHVAHHTRGYNARSIGIELVNIGRYPLWLDAEHQAMDEPYSEAQVAALVALLQTLQGELPSLRFIAGHEDLDTTEVEANDDPTRRVRRKRDPGPLFPWQRVLASIGLERLLP